MSTSPRNLPRFLPTLTEIVRPLDVVQEDIALPLDKEQMIHRVLQRVDLALEPMLREAIAPVVGDQINAMAARLCPGIEAAVRQSVADAVALEFDMAKRP
ncbi:MAG: hypothetical protein RL211_647 [Pseudomonadota bacterium]|jgi:hypothetical protein